jgi:diphthamide biosynthesis methyltransferase
MHWKYAVALLAISSGVLCAQAPPIKMGLWEKTMTMSGDTTMKAKSCVNAESWQTMIENQSKQRPGCNINRTKSGNTYNFSGSCTMRHSSMTIKGSTTIRDAEHIVTEMHTSFTIDGKVRENDTRSEAHFVNSSCGNVKPGVPEL